jgi:hypothetical protein
VFSSISGITNTFDLRLENVKEQRWKEEEHKKFLCEDEKLVKKSKENLNDAFENLEILAKKHK